MRKLIYSMSVSLDGFIAGSGGEIDWSVPDDELFRFHTEQVRELGGHLLGRRLYETMVYWETAEEQPSLPEPEREFARIWKELPKVVFSRTLGSARWSNTRLVRGDMAAAIRTAKAESGKQMAILGSGSVVSQLAQDGLIDEYQIVVNPVVLGSGRTLFDGIRRQLTLRLSKTRTFGNGKVLLCYETGA